MRILSVCSNYRVFGAETITLKMLAGFKQNGHDLLAVTSFHTDGEFSRRLNAVGVNEVKLPFGAIALPKSLRAIHWTAHTLSRLPALWLAWSRLLRAFRPDVVIFTSSRQCLPLYPWLDQCPSFLIEHALIEPNRWNHRIYRVVTRKLACFVAVSDFMRGFFVEMGIPASKIRVVKNGPFFERDRAAIEERVVSRAVSAANRTRLGIVGQIAPNKGYDCLVEATQLLRARGADFEMIAFGSGHSEYGEKIKQRIAALELSDSWKWMGYERDQTKIYGSMDICVMPSCVSESFGMVAAEAGVYGLPVVASRIGGLPEIIEDGATGWLVEPNSPAQLADKIEWLIKNPDRARAMGAAGKAKVFQQFTVEKMVAEFEALFKEFTVRTN
jgi:glycosyltransferase involved in cell wall biosynthesis